MRFLLTNDDGWGTEGLKTLETVASRYGEVVVIAPAEPQSGISHQLTFERPMTMTQNGDQSFALDGTPADCVRIGLTQFPEPFDFVLSGINHGANLGADIYVSGTVAAAREAWLQGVSGIAFSQYRNGGISKEFDWNPTEALMEKIMTSVLEASRKGDRSLVNVNFPDVRSSNLQVEDVGIHWCELDPNPLPTKFLTTNDGFLYNGVYRERARNRGSDIDLCFGGSVAITRLV